MTRLRIFLSRAIGAFRPNRLDDDLRAQIDGHIAEATDEYVALGVPPAAARRRAMRDFGGVARVEEQYRDVQGAWLRDLTKDVRYGARTLRRNPGFTAVAMVSLAIGIGANTTIFSLVNSLLLRPRPIADPERVVELYTGERGESVEGTSYPSYLDFAIAAASSPDWRPTASGSTGSAMGQAASSRSGASSYRPTISTCSGCRSPRGAALPPKRTRFQAATPS